MEIIAAFIFENIANFSCNAHVKNFFLKALKSALQSSHLEGQCIHDTEDSFALEVKGTEQEILDFSEMLQHYIPLSLQWAFKEMLLKEAFSAQTHLAPEPKNNGFLTPLELQRLTQRDSKDFCNLWGDFIDFNQENLPKHSASKESLANALETTANQLKKGERILLKTIFGEYEAMLFSEDTKIALPKDFYFMPFSVENAKLLFKADNEELQALATLEKPSITLSPKSLFAEFFAHCPVKVLLPYEPYLVLLSKFLESHQGLYLLPLALETPPLSISVAKNGLVIPHTWTKHSQNILLKTFTNTLQQNSLTRTNALYLGNYPTRFLVYFNEEFKEALEFSFEANLSAILQTLESLNATTQSLLKNFTKENIELIQRLKARDNTSKLSKNLLDLIGMGGVLLDLDDGEDLQRSALAVFNNALNFMGSKGPRIDFKLERNAQGEIYLNTLKTLRSIMSFKLAGVDSPLLCFGILDSFGEFFANLSRDMNENYQTQGIMICGHLFFNKQFLNQFLHYLPKNSEVYVSDTMEFQASLE